MKKNTPEQVELEKADNEPRYDGVETYTTVFDGTRSQTVTKKINLSDAEAKEFLKGNDPKRYFRKGKISVSVPKAFGELLPDDREEVQVMKAVLKDFDGLLMFKHNRQNLYTILVPKELADFELNDEGDFLEDLVPYDIRVVNFSGGSTPSAFEPGYFKKVCIGDGKNVLGIAGHLMKVRQKRAGYR